MTNADHFLNGFFMPQSVAVVGATNNPLKINYRLVQNLVELGFQGRIFPINPGSNEIFGMKAFRQLQDVPDKIDLVVTAVPASKTMDVVRECQALKIRRLVIVTGGFSEGGEEGQKLHERIASFVKTAEIRTLGPNTLSPVNTANNLAISYNHIKTMKRGTVSLAFQSGFYEPRINWIFSNIGINKILDMGNKMDINEVDALEYFALDPDTKVIGMHMESVRGNGRDFYHLLRKASQEKPTIILKSGRTPAGSKAAASHTGSLARENDLIFDGMIKQTAAVRAHNWQEFFDFAKAFSCLTPPRGTGLAIITMSGGEGVMATDACELNGLRLAQLSPETYQRLKQILPPWDIPVNPFDGGVCMEFHMSKPFSLMDTLVAVPQDEDVSCVIMQMPPNLFGSGVPPETANTFLKAMTQGIVNMKKMGKPFALWRSSMDSQEREWIAEIESRGLPVFDSAERAVTALAAMNRYAMSREALAETV
ncbi:MAG: CoA-binding protein [Candidatus Omnitrophota bacterium]|jgi:acetyltransferase